MTEAEKNYFDVDDLEKNIKQMKSIGLAITDQLLNAYKEQSNKMELMRGKLSKVEEKIQLFNSIRASIKALESMEEEK